MARDASWTFRTAGHIDKHEFLRPNSFIGHFDMDVEVLDFVATQKRERSPDTLLRYRPTINKSAMSDESYPVDNQECQWK